MHRKLLFVVVLLCSIALGAPAWAAEYQAGRDYSVISPPQPTLTNSDSKVEVAEIFWYGCPHCFAFEPHVEPWSKKLPDGVKFVRIPAAFGPVWKTHAKAFYAEKDLGLVGKLHTKIFDAIHKQGKPLDSEDALAKFFAAHGVDEKKFRGTFESFAVETELQRGNKLIRDYGIISVPTLVVDGKYWTNPQLAGSFDNMLKITDYLIQKVRAEKKHG